MTEPTSRRLRAIKLLRFVGIYGWQRTLSKALARTRPVWLRYPFRPSRPATISLIGCGQFAFSGIAYFLQKHRGNAFLSAFDTDPTQAQSLGRYYGFRHVASTPEAVLADPALRLLYVASNHASHTPYAIEGLKRNVDVYVEKPVAVTREQFVQLLQTLHQSTGQLFAGYNRPYAPAIQLLSQRIAACPPDGSFSISCVVNGHQIPQDHWYRHPDEGTRVCGNLGHWLDLTVHLLAHRGAAGRGLPGWMDVAIAYAHPAEPDDNLSVTLTTDCHDVVTLLLTSRCEPFEGISESINVQYTDLIARIDDFRRMTIWQGPAKQTWRFSPKDVGHERAILQPFRAVNRNWSEVELSTLLMLHLTDMVLARQTTSRFHVYQELIRLAADVQPGHSRLLPVTQ